MAEEIKKTTRGRKPKTVVEEKEVKQESQVEEKEVKQESQDEIIKQLMAKIEEQNKMMEELQKKVDSQPTYVIPKENKLGTEKVKVINLMHNELNLSTEPNGQGRVFNFEKYGDSRLIRFDELADIVSTYPNTMENGLAYICNQDAVEALGLKEEYEKIYTKEMMDRIPYLREESDVELFIGMNKALQESTANEIARLINANERMDYNYLRRIKEECGIDIEELAKEFKEMFSKPNENQ